jgi:hypothetical protein
MQLSGAFKFPVNVSLTLCGDMANQHRSGDKY